MTIKSEIQRIIFKTTGCVDNLGNRWMEIAKLLPGRPGKQIQFHFTGSVGTKTKLFLDSVNKTGL